MTLKDLNTGESGIVVKVRGREAFHKRLTEMGFVRGQKVEKIRSAPLGDPIEYRLMGYEISLRRNESELIEIVSSSENVAEGDERFAYHGVIDEETLKKSAHEKGKIIDVVFVGNPNSGKTSLFNIASGSKEKVGNYSGVTVGSKKASFKQDGYTFNITDLPGTYSLSAYSYEELYVRKFIFEHKPDIIVNIVDASNLERNMYLTTQLIDMDAKVVIALNMYDEMKAHGDTFDDHFLSQLIGVPMIPTIANKGIGITELFKKIIDVYEDKDPVVRHIHIHYGEHLEKAITVLQKRIRESRSFVETVAARYYAIKLMERDISIIGETEQWDDHSDLHEVAEKEIARLENIYGISSETIIADSRYGFISGALKETYHKKELLENKKNTTQKIDGVLTHKIWGIPLFLLFLCTMFFTTFQLGKYPQAWLTSGIERLSEIIKDYMPTSFLTDLLSDGIIGGVGGVVVFLPNILLLFFFISIMEDTGYMARVAFIMDKLMHRIGLHGKSFIPMIIGFGCNVPAIMATRTLENRGDRILTMLTIPFMSCSARMPVYILFASVFFPLHATLVMIALYLFGILLAIVFALIFKKVVFKTQEVPFVMELPPYRIPTIRVVSQNIWWKARHYLKKMGGVILIASVVIWALGYFPRDKKNAEDSCIGQIGKFIEPAIRPLGFEWRTGVGLLSGVVAKETIISSMGVLYQNIDDNNNLPHKIKHATFSNGVKSGQKVFTPLTAISLLIFVLIYFPCVAAFTAVAKESGSWKWAFFLAFYTTALAWILSFAVYQIGSLFETL